MTTEGWESKVYHVKQREGKLPINWGKIREKRLIKDSYTCQRCGKRDQLTVHHILPRADGGKNNQGNLITLCSSPCHDEVEELGLRSRALIANWGHDNEVIEDNRPIAISGYWQAWVYGGARRVTPVFAPPVDLPKDEEPIEEIIIQWSELRRQIETAKLEAPLPIKLPEVKTTPLPKPKQVKQVRAKRARRDPIVSFISPDYPVDPGLVAEMYEYYAKRNTPVYICEIFERWLMLETTKEWAMKNGRVLPVSIGFADGL